MYSTALSTVMKRIVSVRLNVPHKDAAAWVAEMASQPSSRVWLKKVLTGVDGVGVLVWDLDAELL